jgi:hypothetical protein
MTSQSPRIYLYKITFEEVSYYYYGSKKEKYFNEEYWGSPVTNKWCWDFYTPKKQILEIFDYTNEGYKECRKVEDRLIKPFFNDQWCLNEACGGTYSIKSLIKSGRMGGIKTRENKSGIFTLTKDQLIENGNKTKELGVGIFAIDKKQRIEISKKAGNKVKELGVGICGLSKEERKKYGSEGGKVGGKKSYEMKTGIHGMDEEKKKKSCINGGQITGKMCKEHNKGIFSLTTEQKKELGIKTSLQRWICLETGYISSPAGLSNYQKKRNIDTSKRKRLE